MRLLVISLLIASACGVDAVPMSGTTAGASPAMELEAGRAAPEPAQPRPPAAGKASQPAQPPKCVRMCLDRVCGPDPVCGESCGACRAGFRCNEGLCLKVATTPEPSEPKPTPPPKPTPRDLSENGATCLVDADCASAFCGDSEVGERHCYGDQGLNETCSTVYDCRGGACVATVPRGVSVCSDGVKECASSNVPEECLEFALGFCQNLILNCPGAPATRAKQDFNACFVTACRTAADPMFTSSCGQFLAQLRAGSWKCPTN